MGSLYENLQVGFLMKEFIFNFGETLVGFLGWGGGGVFLGCFLRRLKG